MTYALVTQAQSGARYFYAGADDLAVMARNAKRYNSEKEAAEARRSIRMPSRDEYGTRLRGFAVQPIAA